LNLPDTVEVAMPNVYADQIEWMLPPRQNRDSLVISLHTHNDRCTGVARRNSACSPVRIEWKELCLAMANAREIWNIVTVALNLYMHGIDAKLDFSNLGFGHRRL